MWTGDGGSKTGFFWTSHFVDGPIPLKETVLLLAAFLNNLLSVILFDTFFSKCYLIEFVVSETAFF